ncbi:MAG: hypothetical protein IKR73_02425 [Oscillospiraceae bacterium]|nr:hypothetical protein [Oscillospiraceae bacterium]
MDLYDEALIFALKKWIADEINEMYDNKICGLVIGLDDDGYIGYTTETHMKSSGADMSDISAWKCPRSAAIDDDDAVYGALEMWQKLKQIQDADMRSGFFTCAREAAAQLRTDGIIRERFGSDIRILFKED